tara:strand:- start:113 stop:382 length:270 start_codon:yes stop_codon:yes gene_type:complete
LFEIVKPCQNCKSYILKPKKKINFDLNKLVKIIEDYSFEILAFTGSMLSIKKECKINIYNSGKVAIISKDLNRVQSLAFELESVLYGKK